MISEIKKRFAQQRVLVIGDAMIDAYYLGAVNRISPEAPVPVIEISAKEKRLGGAANVALNARALGSEVALCALLGNDDNANVFNVLCLDNNIDGQYLVKSNLRSTTVKTRIMSRGQHLLRVDEENKFYTTGQEEKNVLQSIINAINTFQPTVVVFEDYNKGLLSKHIIAETINICKSKNIISTVDPKFVNFDVYNQATMFKPNLKELKEGLKIEVDPKNIESLNKAADVLLSKMDLQKMFITLSEHGVFYKNKTESALIPAHKRKILDVSGAGDTVIAIASLALACGFSDKFSFALANLGGGLVCEKEGVVPIDIDLLIEEAELKNLE